MLGYDFVKVVVVAGLLIVHVLHQGTKMRVGSDYGRSLSLVYGNSSKLSSLVYTKLRTVKVDSKTRQCMVQRTAASRKRSCSAVRGRFLFPEVPVLMVSGFGSVLGGADEVVICATCCRQVIGGTCCCREAMCSEQGDMGMALLHRLS